jgi:hypothetical protein
MILCSFAAVIELRALQGRIRSEGLEMIGVSLESGAARSGPGALATNTGLSEFSRVGIKENAKA